MSCRRATSRANIFDSADSLDRLETGRQETIIIDVQVQILDDSSKERALQLGGMKTGNKRAIEQLREIRDDEF